MFFEELPPGLVIPLGTYPPLTDDDIIGFARQWDPQPFHVDPEAAKGSLYGGLIASGWHTALIGMRLVIDGLGGGAGEGSPGLAEVRFLRPVRPGDSITGRYTVLKAQPSASRPHIGKVESRTELCNQHGEVVLTWVATGFFLRRDVTSSD